MLDFLAAALHNYVLGTIFQKVGMQGMPQLQQIGGDVQGLTIIVTGPTSGIGSATAAELARRGAHVVLACRSQSKGDAMVQQLRDAAEAAGRAPPSLEVSLLDLASLASVRQFVARWERQRRPLHVLVNNAGLFNMGVGRNETPDGLEVHMATNHLAHFLLTLGLLPALRRAAADQRDQIQQNPQQQDPQQQQQQQQQPGFRPRVVMVASDMHRFGYSWGPGDPQLRRSYRPALAYGNSKLAQMLCAFELNRRLAAAGAGVDVIALHPGNVLTDVVRSLPPLVQRAYRALMTRVLLTPDEGARASVFAATDPGASHFAGTYLDAAAKPGRVLAVEHGLTDWAWRWSAEAVQLPEEWDVPGTCRSDEQ